MNAPPAYPPFPPGSPYASPTPDGAPGPGPDASHVPPGVHARGWEGLPTHRQEFPTSAYRGRMPPRPAPPPIAPARGKELVGLVAFVILADVLLYTFGGTGVAQALFFALAAMLVVATAHKRQVSLRLAAVLGLLTLVAVHLSWSGGGFGTVLGVGLLGAAAVVVRMSRAMVVDVGSSIAASAWAGLGRFFSHLRGAKSLVVSRKHGASGARPPFAWSTVLVPIGALVVFAGIFLFANPVLEAWANRALASISFPSPVRPLFWIASAVVGAAILKPALRRAWQGTLGPRSHVAQDDTSAVSPKAFGMARNTLVAVNAIFLLENAVDALSLWVGRPPAGLGYTEYAHRGTAWLTFALVLSTAVLGAIFRGPFHFDPRAGIVKKLAYVWAAQNVILALGTFRRIQLYVDLSGLTSIRILGIFGTTLVVTGFAFVVVMIARKRTIGWLLHRMADALVAFTVLYVAAPTELVSTEWNQRRIFAGQYAPLLNVVVSTQNDENVPALAKLLNHPDPIVSKGTAALLAKRPAPNTSTVAGLVAARSLEQHRARITELSPLDKNESDLQALGKLAGVANEDEARFDYRNRGGVRNSDL